MKFFDDKMKNVRWWNKNLFFLGTLLIIGVNMGLFYLLGAGWSDPPKVAEWNALVTFENVIVNFLSAFDHLDLSHVVLNMVCFFVAGTYIERKVGTVNLLLMVLLFAFVGENIVGANHFGGWSIGFSCVNYALYAYILIDYLFMFRRETRSVGNIIYGLLVLILIYVAMCYAGGGIDPFDVKFELIPVDLLYNMGHYTGALTGLVMALALKITRLEVFHSRDN